MTVSIVMPSHNNATLLEKSLAGFVAQDLCASLQLEIIVIDNNSDDESVAAVQTRFRDKLPLTLIQQPQLDHPFALCKARNAGIRLAKGDWIVSMDADIIPNRSYIETIAQYIKEWGDTPVVAACERVFVSAKDVTAMDIMGNPALLEQLPITNSPSNYGLSRDRRLPDIKQLPNLDHPWDYMHGCNVLYRRQDALKISGYDEAYDGRWGYEDIDFAYRMITEAGCKPTYASGLHVYHQDNDEETPNIERTDKRTNPNWTRVCELIPGYKAYKIAKYRRLSDSIQA
jgi:glycosyltransferase involved in cell wall biosynthesis